ncbi:mitochondrial chaperone bcs1 [Spatholobus suberectus]|nr:mitochondrial chaperone bcs1 [Spatholobus suberectus]
MMLLRTSISDLIPHQIRSFIVSKLEGFFSERQHNHHQRKELYKKVGKPWKLLYGPPGTGKSSLVATMANHLKFDVYDLELSSACSDSDLMRALRDTSVQIQIQIQTMTTSLSRFTLSGLLNYMDGLWSSGGQERITIFTTNQRETIDPALPRPGRMGMHIQLSFLKGKAFPILASNYLGIEGHHPLFEQIEWLLEKIEVTPAVGKQNN